VADYTGALYGLLEQLGVPEQLERWASQASEEGRLAEAREHEQIWEDLVTLLDEVVEALGEEELALNQYIVILDAGLAALRLGAARVAAFDYDPRSVEASTKTLSAHAPGAGWTVEQGDILSPPSAGERFDVVYSYGVLHHTGDMWTAIGNACSFCAPDGLFAVALYVKTLFCGFWKLVKRPYTRLRTVRPVCDAVFAAMLLLRRLAAGQNPWRYVAGYNARRGMDFRTDVRDWLGGFPYESVADAELHRFLAARGFTLVRKNNTRPGIGLLGTACGEWVYRKG